MNILLELQNVRIKYPNGDGVEHVSFAVSPGEFMFLVGPSGAGKSTVLKSIYLDQMPDEGHVRIGEYNSLFIQKKQIPYLRRKLGIVFQDFKLFEDRDVFRNVAFSLEVIGKRTKEVKKRVLRALADVGLSHKSRKFPNELSGGEQQRVAIARAIVNEPYVLLADEPTGNLDPVSAADIMGVLKRINSRGTSIIMATHNYSLVGQYNHRIVRIENGKIL
jgi:cell division transport system ATP-binding protein